MTVDPDLEEELLEAESAEALKARLERELNELLQELRSLITGANVLLGFLLAVSFTTEFAELDRVGLGDDDEPPPATPATPG